MILQIVKDGRRIKFKCYTLIATQFRGKTKVVQDGSTVEDPTSQSHVSWSEMMAEE